MGKRLVELTAKDWRYLAIALSELAFARLRHACVPAGAIVADLKTRNGAAPRRFRSPQVDAQHLAWAIGAVAGRVPFRADCLLRVMAAERVLRRAGLATEFHLGVAKDGADLRAHTWLTCNGEIITGGDASAYTPLISCNVETNA